jgi:hypothetical protein
VRRRAAALRLISGSLLSTCIILVRACRVESCREVTSILGLTNAPKLLK